MSPQAEQQAFRRLLVNEASKDRTLLQPLARSALVALQAIGLACVQFGRAERELPGAIEAGDFDEPYLNSYRSLISGCNALLAAYGYRVRGGDGSHFETPAPRRPGLGGLQPEGANAPGDHARAGSQRSQ